MQNAQAYLGLLRERGSKRLPLARVYRQLYNRELYLKAYGKIYRNAGAMTPGVSGETPDKMSPDKIDTIIAALRSERYQWKPARRVYIEKKHSTKKRPLGMPTWSDKLVQEVLRLILEAYFEPQWSSHSHGFRAGRGCHTALREIYYEWSGTTWFIEGDISACFDSLDHDLLIETLRETVHDGRFLHLIRGLLQAGYLEEWSYHPTLSGTPQGGIVSPTLANILLDRLDKFVETVLIPQYTRGVRKRQNPEYHRLVDHAYRQRKAGQAHAAAALRKQAQRLPSVDPADPTFRRLRYVRYADDFLLGFVGPRAEAEEIKRRLGEFLREELKLELSQAKTLITHARSEAARFLGYEVTIHHRDRKRTARHTPQGKAKCRSINGSIGLRVPQQTLRAKMHRYMRKGKAMHRKELVNESDYTIMTVYQQEYRGLANYYRLAYNLHTLTQLKWVMGQSLTKTLACKHKTTVTKVYAKYRAELHVDGKTYQGLQVLVPRQGKKPLVATWGGISLRWDMQATIQEHPPRIWGGRTELEQRLLAQVCELCGNTDHIEVHHIRALKDLTTYPGRDKPEWVKRMAARQRKTMPLCRTCHDDVHAGRPMRRQTIKLKDALALQKRGSMAAILESRVH